MLMAACFGSWIMHAVCPGVLHGCAYWVIFCSRLFSVVVLVKEEVTASLLKKSVWCKTIFFCCSFCSVSGFCLCFVYSLSNWSLVGQGWGTVGGDALGCSQLRSGLRIQQKAGTPLLAPCSCKAVLFLPRPLPSCSCYIFKAVAPMQIFRLRVKAV